jgi:hypothetical protein
VSEHLKYAMGTAGNTWTKINACVYHSLSIHKLSTICIEPVRKLSVVALIFSGCRVGRLSFGLVKGAFRP